MKTKALFTIAIKIIGLIALWKFLESSGGLVSSLGVFSMVFTGGLPNLFFLFIAISLVLNVFVMAACAYFFLLKTKDVVALLHLEDDEININVDKKVAYHIVVLFLSVLLTINGAGDFLSYDYKTDTKTENNITNNQSSKSTSSTNTKTKKVNYFALIELLAGVVLVLKSAEVSRWLISQYDETENDLEEKSDPYL